jgi:quaternary ammonium compound-resistance protein SugE
MKWIYLFSAGIFEVFFALSSGHLKNVSDSRFFIWSLAVLICLVVSLLLLYQATLHIPIGTAYAIWTGIGAGGTVLTALIFFNEPLQFWKIFFLVLILISVTGLRMTTR